VILSLLQCFVSELSEKFGHNLVKSFTKRVLVTLSSVALFLLYACAPGSSNEQISLDVEPFILMTTDAACADLRNQLYVIDDQFVFWATEGQCDDAGYAYILFGETPNEKLCFLVDSFVGPRSDCEPGLDALFETIQQNLDHPNLGLDENHTVIEVMLG
jgi:hypothetical protein